MKTILVCMIYLFASLAARAQVVVCGTVIDKESHEPLAGVSVMVKGSDGKIKKFAATKADGRFAMSLPTVAGCVLEVSMMSYAKQSIPIEGATFPLKITLEPGTNVLKEVTVKADRIREQGDTVTYFVNGFAQVQDRSIGDVLKRMPGIDVEKSGRIKYQGEAINKFYIEGSDLLGGKYGIATNGISHEDVGAVEVLENHQPMQVLSGISFSDKAAINLKLKNKAKAAWTVHGNAGGGYSLQPSGAIWDCDIFAMAVKPGFQNITTLRTNNTGDDLSVQASDFFASQRGTGLGRYVSLSLPAVPNLSRRRTLFNSSALVSTNGLWKMGLGEVKAQIDYSFNRVAAEASSTTTYFLTGGNRIVNETRSGVNRSNSISAKVIYELNHKTAFLNNTLKTNIDWDNIQLNMTGSLPNTQTGSLSDYYVGNEFKLIKRFKGKCLITFRSENEWESMPQTLDVSKSGESMCEKVRDHAFYTSESAAYAFTVNSATVSFEAGVRGFVRSLRTDLPDLPELLPGETTNVVNTNYFNLFAIPKIEYWVKRINITLNIPVSFATYRFNKALANRNEAYFTPSLRINWKLNNSSSISLRGGVGRSPMDLSRIQPGYVMTDYRTFRRGVEDFYATASQNISAHFSYRHSRHGLFGNAFIMQSWNQNPYTLVQQLYGDYVVYSYSPAKNDGRMFMANSHIGKSLDFMRGSASLNASFTRTDSYLISEERSVSSIGTSWLAGANINGAFLRWFSFDYRLRLSTSRLALNRLHASWLSSMENELMINIIPNRRWECHIAGEHYRNQLTANQFKNVFLLDARLVYKLTSRLELSASLSNIFDRRAYNYITYNQLTSFESQRRLRGRELFISVFLRK